MVGFGFQVREQRVDFLSQSTVQAGANCAGLRAQQVMDGIHTKDFNPMMPRMELETRNYCLSTYEIAGNRNEC